jgi:hypothetical protein
MQAGIFLPGYAQKSHSGADPSMCSQQYAAMR